MGRHKQPAAIARLKGADKKDPQRYRTTCITADIALGDPPEHLSSHTAEAWTHLALYATPGVLTGHDRFIVEIAACLLADMRADPLTFPAGKLSQLVSCLARMGLTPSDRQRIRIPAPSTANPFDEF